MINKLMSLAMVAGLALSGVANAQASRVAAEEAAAALRSSKMGRNFAETVMGIKFPEGEISQTQLARISDAVEAAVKAKPQLTSVLAELSAATKGKSGQAAELASSKVLNFNPVSQSLIKAAASKNAVDTVLGNKQAAPAKTAQEVLACTNSILIPTGARKVLTGFKDCGLPQTAQQVAVEIATQMQADGVTTGDAEAAQLVSILAARNQMSKDAATQGAKTLATKCLVFAPAINEAIGRL